MTFFEKYPLYATLMGIGIIVAVLGLSFGIWYAVNQEKVYVESLKEDGCEVIDKKTSVIIMQQCQMVGKTTVCHPVPINSVEKLWSCPDGREFWR